MSTVVEALATFSARSRTRREEGSNAIQGIVAAALMDSYSRQKRICRTSVPGIRLLSSKKKARSTARIGCATISYTTKRAKSAFGSSCDASFVTRSLLRGVAFGFVGALVTGFGTRRSGTGRLVKLDALGVAPQAFEVVILAGAFAENVHDEKSIIEQHPFGAGFAFAMRGAAPVAMQLFFDGFADGLNLGLARAGTQQEIIGEGPGAGKVQDGNVQSLFFLSGFHGQQDFGIETVKGLSQNVTLHGRGHKPVYGLAAAQAHANFGGGDMAGHCRQQMNGGFAQDDFVGIVGSRAAQFFRRDYQAQSFEPKAGAAGDDEIASVEQAFVVLPGRNFQKLVSADDEVKLIVGMFTAIAPDGIKGVENVRCSAVRRRFSERRMEIRLIRAGQRDHGVAMQERSERRLRFVWRARGRHKINRVQVKALLCCLRHGDMAGVDRIKRAAKKRDRTAMRRAVRFMRGLRAQLSSRGGAAWASSDSASVSWSDESGDETCVVKFEPSRDSWVSIGTPGLGSLSSASAMARTSSTMPSPVGEEIA